MNITVLVSGGGTNLQAILDAIRDRKIANGRVVKVISNKRDAYALTRASNQGIPTAVVLKKDYADNTAFNLALLREIESANTDIIVLAGFLSIIGTELIDKYPDRIINVHPSLIPAFCGDGYYGLKVHEQVLRRGVKVTGATVHFVNEITDAGPIILQKCIDVFDDDTPEVLQKRVMEQAEWQILPKALDLICNNKIKVIDGIVKNV